jgi:hypothetical protein
MFYIIGVVVVVFVIVVFGAALIIRARKINVLSSTAWPSAVGRRTISFSIR